MLRRYGTGATCPDRHRAARGRLGMASAGTILVLREASCATGPLWGGPGNARQEPGILPRAFFDAGAPSHARRPHRANRTVEGASRFGRGTTSLRSARGMVRPGTCNRMGEAA